MSDDKHIPKIVIWCTIPSKPQAADEILLKDRGITGYEFATVESCVIWSETRPR